MARSTVSIDPGTTKKMHTRTDGTDADYEGVVLGIDGTDSVVPADATYGLGSDVKRKADGVDVALGATTDAAVSTDTTGTISGKLRGLVKLLAAALPASLGQKAMAASLPVVLASDQAAIPVTASAGTNLNTSALALESGGNLAGAATSLAVIDDWDNAASDGASVSGDVAHDGADAGEPVKIGAKAIAHGTNPTAVAAGDRTNLYANIAGIPWVIGGHPNVVTAEYSWTGATTDDNILPAISAGTIYVVTMIDVTISKATTVNVAVRIGFGASAVPTAGAANADAVAGVLVSHAGIAPGSGIVKGSGAGVIGIGGDGAELRITAGATTSGEGRVVVTYYTIAS